MKIIDRTFPATTFGDFADRHSLTLVVKERPIDREWVHGRYYAYVEGAEVKEGRLLRSTYGNGVTPDKAISEYAGRLRGLILVINADGDDRRELQCPNEWLPEPDVQ